MFQEQFAAAFEKVAHKKLDSGVLQSPGGFRDGLHEDLTRIGYRASRPGNSPPPVLVSEPRHIPYLILDRTATASPVLHFLVTQAGLTLVAFGPLNEDRRSPYVQYDIDCSSAVPTEPQPSDGDVLATVRHDIAVGVHSYEEFLRSDSPDHHRAVRLAEPAQSSLDALVAQNLRRPDLLSLLFSAIGPMVLFVGHDCYTQAIDTNVALRLKTPVVLLPKGKPCQAYSGDDSPGSWSGEPRLFFSHMHRWLSREMARRWDDLTPAALEDVHRSMQTRLESIPSLSVMNIGYANAYLDPHVSWNTFQKAIGMPFDDPTRRCESGQVRWIFALHCFADEAFRWGMDLLPSVYEMFVLAARLIRQAYPSDILVIRPHPHSIGVLSETVLERKKAGDTRSLWARHFDAFLQLDLCGDLAATGIECRLSPLVPTGQLLQPDNSVVVTRNGNMVMEAAWLGRIGIFSRVAPYAFLFPDARKYHDADSLRDAIVSARETALGGSASFPDRDQMARYQTILETPYGFRREPIPGGLVLPVTTHTPMRNFDDFAYPSETVAEAAARLLSCLRAPEERTAFARVLGRSDREGKLFHP